MNSELLNDMLKKLKELKKEKQKLSKQINIFRSSEDLLSRKGKAKLAELIERRENIITEIESVKRDYDDYASVSQEVEKLRVLIEEENKDETKKILEGLYEDKSKVLAEYEESFIEAYGSKPEVPENLSEDTSCELIDASNVSENPNSLIQNELNGDLLDEEKNNQKEKSRLKKIYGTAFGLALILALFSIGRGCSKSKNDIVKPLPTEEVLNVDDLLAFTPTQSPISNVDMLNESVILQSDDVSGITDRAEEVLSDLDYLNEMDHSFDGEELNTLVNIIRVSNGELPLDENNEEYYDPNAVDKYVQARTDIFANYPSSTQLDKIYDVNYADIVTDDVDLQKFAEKYDEVYNMIAEARNNNDWDSFAISTQKLGKMLYSDWVLQGMYDGNNPYNFEPDQRLLALGISTERYASYVMEYENGHRGTICVDVCVDYETGDTKEIPVEDIFNAIVLGVSNDATLAVNAPSGYQIISEEFYKSLVNELNYKNQLLLKLN